MTLQELIKLIYENDIPKLKKLKMTGIDFSIEDSYDKRNILIAYSGYGYNEKYSQSEMIDFLVDCGINIDLQTNKRANKYSALHMAVANNHFEITDSLINHGAQLEILDSNGNTPLWVAIMNFRGDEESLNIINQLIASGASLKTKNNHGISSLDIIHQIGSGIDAGFNDKSWDLRFLLN